MFRIVMLFFMLVYPLDVISASEYHAPETQAEKQLDSLLQRANVEDELFDFVLLRPWYQPKAQHIYSQFFTDALLHAYRQREAVLVHENCDGVYREGEICGLDFNPITWS
jgi:glycine/D-amino acid oxidase-like deaminating enzyme